MSYHSYTSTSTNQSTPSTTTTTTVAVNKQSFNAEGLVAPDGFHYMPDGTLMSDVEHAARYGSGKVIRGFDLDLSDLPATSERRRFNILGDKEAEFKLEIKDNTTGYYYNFVTNVFQAASSSLEEQLYSRSYN